MIIYLEDLLKHVVCQKNLSLPVWVHSTKMNHQKKKVEKRVMEKGQEREPVID